MPNPTRAWDRVPVWARYSTPHGEPITGKVSFSIAGRLTRVDGTVLYPGDWTETITIGDTSQQDPAVRSLIRTTLRNQAEAQATADGNAFDGTAWDVEWDRLLPGSVFTSFPAVDDPDIVQGDFQVMVLEQLTKAKGKTYFIDTYLSSLPLGVNLNMVEVPPGAPTNPAPVYAKGVAGGVASLDAAGRVPLEQLPEIPGGGEAIEFTEVGAQLAFATSRDAARGALGAGTSDLELGDTEDTAKRGDWRPNAGDVIDLDLAVQQVLENTGGFGGRGGDTLSVFWREGAWVCYLDGVTPTPLPDDVPSGVRVRHFYGPTQHMGDTPAGVIDKYSYTELT